jgi:hypothetical protein
VLYCLSYSLLFLGLRILEQQKTPKMIYKSTNRTETSFFLCGIAGGLIGLKICYTICRVENLLSANVDIRYVFYGVQLAGRA